MFSLSVVVDFNIFEDSLLSLVHALVSAAEILRDVTSLLVIEKKVSLALGSEIQRTQAFTLVFDFKCEGP